MVSPFLTFCLLPLSLAAFYNRTSHFSNVSCRDNPLVKKFYDCYDQDALDIGNLGSGAFGSVYACLHRYTGDLAAMKEMHLNDTKLKKHPYLIKVARQEIVALEEINKLSPLHPAVTKGIDSFLFEDVACIGMEFVYGKRLHSYLLRDHADEVTIRDAMVKIIDVLEYLHARNVSHNDVSTNNFLVKSSKVIKIIDFGLARVVQEGDSFRRLGYSSGSLSSSSSSEKELAKPTEVGENAKEAWREIRLARTHYFSRDLYNLASVMCQAMCANRTKVEDSDLRCYDTSVYKDIDPVDLMKQLRVEQKLTFTDQSAQVFRSLLMARPTSEILEMEWFKMDPAEIQRINSEHSRSPPSLPAVTIVRKKKLSEAEKKHLRLKKEKEEAEQRERIKRRERREKEQLEREQRVHERDLKKERKRKVEEELRFQKLPRHFERIIEFKRTPVTE